MSYCYYKSKNFHSVQQADIILHVYGLLINPQHSPTQCSYIYSNFFNYNCKLGHLIVNGFVMNKSIFIQSVYFAGNVIGKKCFQQKLQILNKTQKAVLCCKLHVTAICNIKLHWNVLKAIDYQSFKLIDKLTKSTFNEFR